MRASATRRVDTGRGVLTRSFDGVPVRTPRPSWHGASGLNLTQRSHLQRGQITTLPVRESEPLFVCHGVATKAERLAKRAELEAEKEPEAKAILRFARGSPHKMRRTIDTIRGRTYEEALMILECLPYRATDPILQTLLSAAANAKHNLGMKKTRLYVSECYVDEAPVLKRFRCRAKGRPGKILKRSSHITVKVKEREGESTQQFESEPAAQAPSTES